MRAALDQFEENLRRAKELGTLFEVVQNMTTPALDLTDILRAEIVQSVSSLDHFIHEVVRLGMIEIAEGKRPPTKAYERFLVPTSVIRSAIQGVPHAKWLGEVIRENHGWQSFQQPDKIAESIRLITEIKLWDEVAKVLNSTAKNVRDDLQLIVDRRNKISHEADMDPTNPGFRWPITPNLANDVVRFINGLAHAIFTVAV
jgi:HEPN superfamily RiboL-PSP-like protein